MKNTLRFLVPTLSLVILFLAFSAAPLEAQRRAGRGPGPGGATPALRVKSRVVLNRTNRAITQAQRAVAASQVYTGNLAKAVAHQRVARKLHRRGLFVRAIHHSRRARVLAFAAITANRQAPPPDLNFSAEEAAEPNTPSDAQLDGALATEEPNAPTDDRTVLQEAQEDVD